MNFVLLTKDDGTEIVFNVANIAMYNEHKSATGNYNSRVVIVGAVEYFVRETVEVIARMIGHPNLQHVAGMKI